MEETCMNKIKKKFNFTTSLNEKGVILGYRRSLRHQKMSEVRILIPISKSKKLLNEYIGKKVFYLVKNKYNRTKKVKWGKILSKHGNNGVFLAKFKKQIPSSMIMSGVFITNVFC